MRFVLGMIVGVLLATVVGAGAVSLRWYTAGGILTKERISQLSYVAGVYDATTAARDLLQVGVSLHPENVPLQTGLALFNSRLSCMNNHNNTLGELTDWAVSQWTSTTNDDLSAAKIMLDGCPRTTPPANTQ